MTLKVDTITNVAGTGAPNIPDGVTIAGTALASVNQMEYVSSAEPPSAPADGAIWWSTGDEQMFLYVNNAWYELTTTPPPVWYGSRGLFGGGFSAVNTIDYVTIATAGNATDFGDLSSARYALAACSNTARGLFGGGSPNSIGNEIEYVTVATTGNSTAFGDLTKVVSFLASCSSGVRGLFAGGTEYDPGTGGSADTNTISYVTIATTGNAVDFGDLTVARDGLAACSNGDRGVFGGDSTLEYVTIATTGNATNFGNFFSAKVFLSALSSDVRGVFGGGYSTTNIIQYITIATTGNATDFGDLTVARNALAGCANGTRGVFGGGDPSSDTIDYITIATPGNATDFGNLTVGRKYISACSGT
tara:strand:+ start:554 stop:1636 length:1083 start_codon:yes stop_codon:yes gene_type:complete